MVMGVVGWFGGGDGLVGLVVVVGEGLAVGGCSVGLGLGGVGGVALRFVIADRFERRSLISVQIGHEIRGRVQRMRLRLGLNQV